MSPWQWAQIAIAILVGSFTVVAALWGVARSRMADQLVEENAFKVMRLELKDAFRSAMEEAKRAADIELSGLKKAISDLDEQRDLDHKSALAQIGVVAEHKALAAVRPVEQQVEFLNRRFDDLKVTISEMDRRNQANFDKVFELIRQGVHV